MGNSFFEQEDRDQAAGKHFTPYLTTLFSQSLLSSFLWKETCYELLLEIQKRRHVVPILKEWML